MVDLMCIVMMRKIVHRCWDSPWSFYSKVVRFAAWLTWLQVNILYSWCSHSDSWSCCSKVVRFAVYVYFTLSLIASQELSEDPYTFVPIFLILKVGLTIVMLKWWWWWQLSSWFTFNHHPYIHICTHLLHIVICTSPISHMFWWNVVMLY